MAQEPYSGTHQLAAHTAAFSASAWPVWPCFLRDYLLYMVKAGHIAVLVEVMEEGETPGGRGQIEHAQSVVKEPFGMAALIQVFFKVTEGQQPDPEWEQKLESVSDKFGEMTTKATQWAGNMDIPKQDSGAFKTLGDTQ